MGNAIDPVLLARRVVQLNVLIDAHAGGIELVKVDADGRVFIRFTGMCRGCDYRPLTTLGTIEPVLMDIPGVTAVTVIGARVSDEALARIRATMDAGDAARKAIRLVRAMDDNGPH